MRPILRVALACLALTATTCVAGPSGPVIHGTVPPSHLYSDTAALLPLPMPAPRPLRSRAPRDTDPTPVECPPIEVPELRFRIFTARAVCDGVTVKHASSPCGERV